MNRFDRPSRIQIADPSPKPFPFVLPMPNLTTLHRRLLRPWSTELRRFVANRFRMPVTLTADRLGEFRFRAQNATEVARTLDYGHELVSLAAFLFLLKPDDVVWDLGASVGLFTVHAAARCSEVVAFEPDPPTFARLKENVALNGFSGKVRFEGCAVGQEPGTLELSTDGLHGLAPSLAMGTDGRHKNRVAVPVETIDRLVGKGVPAPTVLKVDIEGAEILALRGGRTVLSGPKRPRLLFVEVHPLFLPNFGATADDVDRCVVECGYRLLSTQKRDAQYHLIAVAAD